VAIRERRICGIPAHQLRTALLGVWFVITAVTSAPLVVTLYAPSLAAGLPQCEAKRVGSKCPLCGMTTAFLLISQGDVGVAQSHHRGSVPLYAGIALNAAGAALFVWKRLKKGRTCRLSL
jgi:hypothetical protein